MVTATEEVTVEGVVVTAVAEAMAMVEKEDTVAVVAKNMEDSEEDSVVVLEEEVEHLASEEEKTSS